ncbi:MAG: aminotransferase class III-fold pyridoxal phosphate-dependent enzyme [Verrucomicrobiota bacterium]
MILRHQTGAGVEFFTLYGHLGRECLTQLRRSASPSPRAKPLPRSARRRSTATGRRICISRSSPTCWSWGVDFPGVAAPGQAALWTSLSPDPNVLLGIPADRFPAPPPSPEADAATQRQARIGRNLSISYRQPLKIVRGLAQYLYDESGRAYLDGVNNVAHVGHCHPYRGGGGSATDGGAQHQHALSARLDQRIRPRVWPPRCPPALSVFFFVNSGSEANDLALRLARTVTGRQDVITVDVAYHGHTQALIEISPYKHDGPGGAGRPPYVQKVIMPDPYRGPYLGYGAACGSRYAGHVQQAVQQIQAQGRSVAAFICESVLGCGGQIVFPDGYMAEAFRHVRARRAASASPMRCRLALGASAATSGASRRRASPPTS